MTNKNKVDSILSRQYDLVNDTVDQLVLLKERMQVVREGLNDIVDQLVLLKERMQVVREDLERDGVLITGSPNRAAAKRTSMEVTKLLARFGRSGMGA